MVSLQEPVSANLDQREEDTRGRAVRTCNTTYATVLTVAWETVTVERWDYNATDDYWLRGLGYWNKPLCKAIS